MIDGILNIYKPSGITSHGVVSRIRKLFGIKRVGHAGTLDPLATGVLIILLGKSTKLFDRFVNTDKAYRATLLLGQTTDSADIQGEVIQQNPIDRITPEQVRNAFACFQGELQQIPPMYSALKYKGKKLYELARQGITVQRDPRHITIYKLEIEGMCFPEVSFYLECSKGTYVRQLAEDIGARLKCGACISKIERTKVGEFDICQSVKLEDVNESHIQHWPSQTRS
ncbi:MAG: tRNA pseudouridine(55) synthase TruB [Candidatus Omnitrophica bacterium]|nr:tRNA pseudouridine(55) synthase TruB [Candidatus Omnitrophota bacterium]